MDGTTKAAESCMFLTTKDIQDLKLRKNNASAERSASMFGDVQRVVNRMKRRGFFKKPWILLPLNLGNFHWVFVALLNVTYLGGDQEGGDETGNKKNKNFTAFFYYDSLNPEVSRDDALKAMSQYGVVNMIIYANLVFGNPRMTGADIKEKLGNPEFFPKIEVPISDFVRQEDSNNCGVFVWICLMEMSLVHCRRYLEKKDFDEQKSDDGSSSTFYLQKGDWFKLLKDPSKTNVTSLHHSIFETIRHHALVLFNRILNVKTKKNRSPRNPEQKLPQYVFTNLRKYVWEIKDGNRLDIDGLMSWIQGDRTAELNRLIACENPAVIAPETVYLDGAMETDEDDAVSEDKVPEVSDKELVDAGMQEPIIVDDDGDDDEDDVVKTQSKILTKPAPSSPKRKDPPVTLTPDSVLLPSQKRVRAESEEGDDKENAKTREQNLSEVLRDEAEEELNDENDIEKEKLMNSNTETAATTLLPLDKTAASTQEQLTKPTLEEQPTKPTPSEDDTTRTPPAAADDTTPELRYYLPKPASTETPTKLPPTTPGDDSTVKKMPATRPSLPRRAKPLPLNNNAVTAPTFRDGVASKLDLVARMPAKQPRNPQAKAKKLNPDRPVPVPDEHKVYTEMSIMNKFKNHRTKKDFPLSQQTLKDAYPAVSAMANLPNNADERQEWKSRGKWKQKSNESDYHYHQRDLYNNTHYQNFQRVKKTEALLHKFDSVTALLYKPPEDKTSVRKGSFLVKLFGTEDVVEVTRDWVMNNFEEVVVHSVVNDCIGNFVTVPDDHAKVMIPLDKRQIQKLRWIVPDREGKEPFFQGILSDESAIKLGEEFVTNNFSDEFIRLVKSEGEKKKWKFFHVPPGAPRTTEGHPMMDDRFPHVQHMQNGKPTCLFSSCASALHYLGFEESAKYVQDKAQFFSSASPTSDNLWYHLKKVMQETCRILQPVTVHGSMNNILSNTSPYPIVVALEDMEGGTHHAVTIVGRLIFDSNCSRALPLTMRSLNYCCSTDKVQGKFKKIYKGLMFREDPKKKNKVLDKLRKKIGFDLFLNEVFSDDDDDDDVKAGDDIGDDDEEGCMSSYGEFI